MSTPIVLILAGARTGSTLLSTTFDNHPDAVSVVEPLNGNLRARQKFHRAAFGNEGKVWRPPEFKPEYLDRTALMREDKTLFIKMLYPQMEFVWQWFLNHPDVRVVHLVRNPICSYISRMQARRTGRWHAARRNRVSREFHTRAFSADPEGGETPPLVDINMRIVSRVCWGTDSVRSQSRGLYQNRKPFLEVCYHDLLTDFQGTMASIMDFAGLPRVGLEPALRKLDPRPMRERVGDIRLELNPKWQPYWEGGDEVDVLPGEVG